MYPLSPFPFPFPQFVGYRDDDLDNTWNAYACEINETVILENAMFLNNSGLLDAGYNYFVLDGTDLPYESRIYVALRVYDRLLDGE
jgi:hypothetical protein